MDPPLTILCGFIISLIHLVFFTNFIISSLKKSDVVSVPPGKMGLPLLGESIEFARFKGHPERRPESFVLDRIRRYSSNTFKTHLMGYPIAVMHGTAGNKFLFANEDKLVKVFRLPGLRQLIKSTEGERSIKMRDLTHDLLKSDGLQKRVGEMDRIAKVHIEDKWKGRQQVNVQPLTEDYVFSLSCHQFLSINDAHTIQSLAIPMASMRENMYAIPINLPWTQFGRAMRASRLLRERLKVIIRNRRAEILESSSSSSSAVQDHHHDVLSLMVSATIEEQNGEENEEDDEVIADQLVGFLLAGHLSSIVITLVINLLAQHPDIYQKVLQEQLEVAATKLPGELLNLQDIEKMRYSWNVACEAMRLYSPAPLLFKQVIQDFVYDGFCIPKGWKILVSTTSVHKDPRLFPEPDVFDPSRFEGKGVLPYSFLPFGGGRRICPGNRYAKLQMLVFLHNIIMTFEWDKVHANEVVLFAPLPKLAHGLPVHLHPCLH